MALAVLAMQRAPDHGCCYKYYLVSTTSPIKVGHYTSCKTTASLILTVESRSYTCIATSASIGPFRHADPVGMQEPQRL